MVLAASLGKLGYHDIVMPRYGKVWGKSRTEHVSRQKGKAWAALTQPGDVLIGHSNGGRIAWEMSYNSEVVKRIILLHPALDHYLVPHRSVEKFWVFYNQWDKATRMARFIPWSDWGDMGRVGYDHNDDGLWNDPRYCGVDIGRGHTPFIDPVEADTYAMTIAACLH